jgi:signal transduction histidine kinase
MRSSPLNYPELHREKNAAGAESLKEEMQSQLDYVNEVIKKVRRLYHDLSPGDVDVEDLGLTKALRNLFKDFVGHIPQKTSVHGAPVPGWD